MQNVIVFGSLIENETDDVLDENSFERMCGEEDLSYGVVLAKIYGFKLPNSCITLDSPVLSVMPRISSLAQECGYNPPVRAWAVYEQSFNKYKAKAVDIKSSDGISIKIEDFHIEDDFFVGVVRVKVVALGAQLVNVGIPFKTKSDCTLLDQDIKLFRLKVTLSVRNVMPPEICISAKVSGPGYKDSKKICVKP